MPMAQRRRRSPEPAGRVRRRGTPGKDSAKATEPADGGAPAHLIPTDGAPVGGGLPDCSDPARGSRVDTASGAATGTVGEWPECDDVVTADRVAWGVAVAVTVSSEAPFVGVNSGRLRRGSGLPPAWRERRAASAMAAKARGLSLWSLWFRGLRACTISLRRGTCLLEARPLSGTPPTSSIWPGTARWGSLPRLCLRYPPSFALPAYRRSEHRALVGSGRVSPENWLRPGASAPTATRRPDDRSASLSNPAGLPTEQ
jgi:hypothetical protein